KDKRDKDEGSANHLEKVYSIEGDGDVQTRNRKLTVSSSTEGNLETKMVLMRQKYKKKKEKPEDFIKSIMSSEYRTLNDKEGSTDDVTSTSTLDSAHEERRLSVKHCQKPYANDINPVTSNVDDTISIKEFDKFMEVGGQICNSCLAGINRPPVSWLPNIRLHANRCEPDSRVYNYSG
ncbi:hypothetical protein RYX36_003205, partial [Vicia faba]